MVLPFATTDVTDTLVPEPSDDPVSLWLDRVTRRLNVDRELQLEVRQELRSHLEESVAELRGAGRSESDARDEALRALGDEDDLAEQLWRANRRRVRLRAVAVWAARVVLPGAVAALVAYLAAGAIVTARLATPTVFGFNISYFSGRDDDDNYRAAALTNASADIKLLSEANRGGADQRIAVAKQLVELRPDDRVLYAYYAATVARHTPINWKAIDSNPVPEESQENQAIFGPIEPLYKTESFERALKVFAEGERREPGNALYPAMAASFLFQASSINRWDPAQDILRPGQKDAESWDRLTVYDPSLYAEARAAASRAAAAPYFRSYVSDLAVRNSSAIRSSRLADIWLRGEAERDVLQAWYASDFAWSLASGAVESAKAGDRESASRMLGDLRMIIGKFAAGADVEDEVYRAGVYARLADEADARIHLALGDTAGAEHAWAQFDVSRHRFDAVRRRSDQAETQRDQAGLLYNSVLYDAFRNGVNTTPMRQAEYATADQLGIAVVSTGLLSGAAIYALVAGAQWVRARRRVGQSPPRLFVGWRRLSVAVGLGGIAPILAYWVYTRIEPLSGRQNGLNITLGRVLLEYGALTMTVLLLVATLARRAVQNRMTELGVAPTSGVLPLPAWRQVVAILGVILGAACLLGVLAAAVGVFNDVAYPSQRRIATPLLATAWAALFCAATVTLWRRRQSMGESSVPAGLLAGTIARSAFPVMLVAALIVGLVGLPLRWAEVDNVAAAIGSNSWLISENPVGASGYDAIREELMRQYEVSPPRQ